MQIVIVLEFMYDGVQEFRDTVVRSVVCEVFLNSTNRRHLNVHRRREIRFPSSQTHDVISRFTKLTRKLRECECLRLFKLLDFYGKRIQLRLCLDNDVIFF